MSKVFCSLPWMHLASHPHGGTTICCVANHEGGISRARNWAPVRKNVLPNNVGNDEFLNLKDHSIEQLMNADSFNELRLQMLNGEEPVTCKRCFREEENGIHSKRLRENEIYSHHTEEIARANTNEDGSIKAINLEFIELRLGNICNAKCRTCNPWSSSKWIADYNKLQSKFTTLDLFDKGMNQFDWPEQEKFWDDLFENSKNAKVFYINGGEPTLIKEHFRFLKRMIKAGRTNVKLWYNINMTNMTEEIIEIWKQFDYVEVGFSIDDVEDRNEYIRHPTKWADVTKSVNMLKKARKDLPFHQKKKFKFSVTQTVSWMNYFYLVDMLEWAADNELQVHHNFVTQPDYYSVNVLPQELRKLVTEEMRNYFEKDGPLEAIDSGEREWAIHTLINQLVSYESAPTDIDSLKKALEHNEELDKLRNENFRMTFPELSYELDGYLRDDV